MMSFAIVALNWNAAGDSIECLDSIVLGDADGIPVVVDNGSEDDSVPRLLEWAESRGVPMAIIDADHLDRVSEARGAIRCVLVRSPENLGFAKGCNLGLRAAKALGVEATVFLNNDTIVAPGALSRLVRRLASDSSIYAVIPQIRIHGTGLIWNCGGEVSRLGYRRYYHAGARLDATSLPAEIACTFFTGCCFAVRTDDFAGRGGFSERFFFGEEDFELCLWMLDHRKRAVVLTESIVDHKVSVAFTKASRRESAKVYVYYLNRFIHMRLRLGALVWSAWLAFYLPYAARLLLRNSALTASEVPRFVLRLVSDAWRHDGVDRALFMSIMRAEPW